MGNENGRGRGDGRSGNGGYRRPDQRNDRRPFRPNPNFAKRPPALPDARKLALNALTSVVNGGAYSTLALGKHLTQAAHLSPEDKRLAASIFHAALENRLRISYVLSQFVTRMPEGIIEDILHIAAAQMLLMDKVPDHAAVDEAVKQVKAAGLIGQDKFVNGTLRNLIRARDAGTIAYPDKEQFPIRYLSVMYSLSELIVQRIVLDYGLDEAEKIIAYRPDSHSTTVRPNFLREDAVGFEAYAKGRGWEIERGLVEGAYKVKGMTDISTDEDFKAGRFSVISEPSMLAAMAVKPMRGQSILDACAAPGGKSALICELMGGSGRVFAWELHEHRAELIRAQKARLGLDNLRVAPRDATIHRDELEGALDAVLIDAPCSGLGVMNEKADIKFRMTPDDIDSLAALQAKILDACAGYVRPNGVLVYSTCTIIKDENERQVDAFLARHPEFALDADMRDFPPALLAHARGGMLQILPYRDGLEGFFIARMRRKP